MHVNDRDRSIFKDAAATVEDFTESELAQIREIASQLYDIMKDAKGREQTKFKSAVRE